MNPIIQRMSNYSRNKGNNVLKQKLNRIKTNHGTKNDIESIIYTHSYLYPKKHKESNVSNLRRVLLSKFNKYVEEIKKLAKNNQNLRVNVNKNTIILRHGPGNSTYVKSYPLGTNDMYIALGETHPNLRSQGIGKKLRAIITLAANKAGYKKVKQTAAFINKNTTVPTNKDTKKGNVNKKTGKSIFRYPPSHYVLKSLGYNVIFKEGSYKNRNGQKIPEGRLLKHEYNFSKKKTPSNRQRLLNALVISHP